MGGENPQYSQSRQLGLGWASWASRASGNISPIGFLYFIVGLGPNRFMSDTSLCHLLNSSSKNLKHPLEAPLTGKGKNAKIE